MLNFKQDQKYFYSCFFVSFFIPLVVYFYTMPEGLTWGDGSELAMAIINLGVPHPSGYPLFVLLGKLFSLLPFNSPLTGIYIMCMLFQAGTISILFLIIRNLTKKNLLSLFTVLFLSVTLTFWDHGRKIEVYSLNNLITSGIILYLIKWIQNSKLKYFYILSVLVGLGICNHLMIVLILPLIFFVLLTVNKSKILRVSVLFKSMMIMLTLFSMYIYIFLSANFNKSSIVWNNPSSFKTFLYHITGSEYQAFRTFSVFYSSFVNFFKQFYFQFSFFGVFLGILGIYSLYKKNKILFYGLGLYLFLLLIYIFTYNITDIGDYYLIPFLIITIFIGCGISWLLEQFEDKNGYFYKKFYMQKNWKKYVGKLIYLFLLFPIFMFFIQNKSIKYKDILAHSFGIQVEKELPQKYILITQKEGVTFTMMYKSYVSMKDKNKIVVSEGLFADNRRVWYRNFLKRQNSDINWPPVSGNMGEDRTIYLIKNNYGKIPIYTIFHEKLDIPGFLFINRGFVSEVISINEKNSLKIKATNKVWWTYISPVVNLSYGDIYPVSKRIYSKTDTLACIIEWKKGVVNQKIDFSFKTPAGEVYKTSGLINTKNSVRNVFDLNLKNKNVVQGDWLCEIKINSELISQLKFKVKK
jgi:Protein O-mannosyl-transferase TMEM260-like